MGNGVAFRLRSVLKTASIQSLPQGENEEARYEQCTSAGVRAGNLDV